jgi:hypothetical protein
MQTFAYGHDFGNAETCGVMFARGRRVSRCVVSAIAQGDLEELKKLSIRLGANHFVFKAQGNETEQFVGDLALEQSMMSFNGRGDISRYWSEKSLIMLLTVASSLVDDAEFGLNVVTGLPVQTYLGDPECRKKIKQALEGTHVFVVNERKRIIHVQVERVIMEGAGATIAYGSREKMTQGVIDIGGRTTDLFVAEGQTPMRHMCAGKALGVEIAGDLLSANFQRKYGRVLKSYEVRRILRAHASRSPMPHIVARGEQVPDLDSMTREALKQIGDEIISFVSSKWSESEAGSEVASSFSSVLSIGGGAHYFYDQLQKRVPNLQFIEHPEEANAYGYAVFAESQLQRVRAV